jgi:hypothetical protein
MARLAVNFTRKRSRDNGSIFARANARSAPNPASPDAGAAVPSSTPPDAGVVVPNPAAGAAVPNPAVVVARSAVELAESAGDASAETDCRDAT